MTSAIKKTGEALIDAGVITRDQLQLCLRAQNMLRIQQKHVPIGEILLTYGFASRRQVDEAIRLSGNTSAGLASVHLPASVLRRYEIMPMTVVNGVARIGALRDLHDLDRRQIIEAYRNEGADIDTIDVVPRDRSQIISFLQSLSHVDPLTVEQEVAAFCADHTAATLLQRLKEHIVHEALQMRASDIHVERSEDPLFCLISYRIDNALNRRHILTVEAMQAFASAIKLWSHLDASERNRPQDGRTSIEYHGSKIDVRVSTSPTDSGESIVIRLLDQSRAQSIDEILFYHPTVANWMKTIADVRGKEGALVLVTGPTGAGKSTTLTSIMRAMRRDKLKIVTAEDPVETRVPLTNQSKVNEAANLGYAELVRSFLRQDPDVIVVGEIRDQETAAEALKGADTGHLVMATLHTNTVNDSIKRTIALIPDDQKAIALFTLADRLKLVANQRLALQLCSCSHEVEVSEVKDPTEEEFLSVLSYTGRKLRRRTGCSRCDHTGYFGRTLMVEAAWFPSDTRVREQMEIALRGSHVSELLRIEGVQHYTREMSVIRLLAGGAIDLDIAMSLTDFHLKGHGVEDMAMLS